MAFTYGSDALNTLAQGVDREPADLSTKADVSALATTNAIVATKQTTGEPVKYDAQVITADAALDPDIAYWLLDATTNPVTLTFPAVGTVEGRQFTVTVLNSDNGATMAAQAGEFFMLAGKPSASVSLLSGTTMVLVARTVPGLPPIWVSQGIVSPNLPSRVRVVDTTSAGASAQLPLASLSEGLLLGYKNSGTGSHTVVVTTIPGSGDTIDGQAAEAHPPSDPPDAGAITVPDGKTATFVRDDSNPPNPTNWVLISLA